MATVEELERGTQIVYTPTGEAGWVQSVSEDGEQARCRFWSRDLSYLRTMSCAELTPVRDLAVVDSVPQTRVQETMRLLEEQERRSGGLRDLVRRKLGLID